MNIYIYIYLYITGIVEAAPESLAQRMGSAPRVGRHSTMFLILSENSACQVPICAVAA